ncbi:hypothetical protein PVAP13_6NG022901 [Panicum virgatum]|uniref:Uncharacterized protein n=1 Tax=Panicum virgatum TaxID=38727 RepID=A0A8T0QSL3_PANVG|nr:hypothetical protein PVAP13_6NG022901 [Panicum virgatum]KAG2576020.1 hypothetical protein PVAP13_6NG022901 [Panicum virgatum]
MASKTAVKRKNVLNNWRETLKKYLYVCADEGRLLRAPLSYSKLMSWNDYCHSLWTE